jgi:hypothetical protein
MPARSSTASAVTPARTHQQAVELFRRPFAPGAIGFRAMSKVPFGDDPWGGAQVAAYLNAQSVIQRLNHVVPGRWRHEFAPLPSELVPADGARRRLYLVCRLIVTLPAKPAGPEVEAVYEDIGELDPGSLAGLKALYSDARKRAGVAAGIGAYLYTALEPVALALGTGPHQVQCIRRSGKSDLLIIGPETERWLRDGYRTRMSTAVVIRDLGAMLAHGEPEHGMGQGESTDEAALAPAEPTTADPAAPADATGANGNRNGNGEVVEIDFSRLGPTTPPAA